MDALACSRSSAPSSDRHDLNFDSNVKNAVARSPSRRSVLLVAGTASGRFKFQVLVLLVRIL